MNIHVEVIRLQAEVAALKSRLDALEEAATKPKTTQPQSAPARKTG